MEPAVEDVVDYLQWYEIVSTCLERRGGRRSSADVIVRRALTSECDLLVMLVRHRFLRTCVIPV